MVDLANAHIKSLEYLNKITKPNFYDTFNIGTGQGSSVFDLINSFQIVSKQILKYKIGKKRKGDVGECYANVNKANKILNWKSKLSIEDSLLSAWNWEKKINNEKL